MGSPNPAEGLRLLARWFDESPRVNDMDGTEVQDDLRSWADELEHLRRIEKAARRLMAIPISWGPVEGSEQLNDVTSAYLALSAALEASPEYGH